PTAGDYVFLLLQRRADATTSSNGARLGGLDRPAPANSKSLASAPTRGRAWRRRGQDVRHYDGDPNMSVAYLGWCQCSRALLISTSRHPRSTGLTRVTVLVLGVTCQCRTTSPEQGFGG